MKKVIVKTKLKSREKFIKKLAEMELEFSPVYYQHDRVYVPRSYAKSSNFARLILRSEISDLKKTPRYRLILKRHINDSGIDIINNTIIKDYTEAVHIIHQLGYEKQAELSRQRQKLKLADNSTMYLDKVENLSGYYAKIENTIEDNDKVSETLEDIERTFEILGEQDKLGETYADQIQGD